MKKTVHNRLLCIILMISMFVLGIYCEDIHTNSFFSYASSEADAAALQPVRNVSDTDSYCEKNALSTLEHFIAVQHTTRSLSVFRLGQLFILALLLIAAFQFLFSFRNSYLHTSAYANRYHQRTLEYIHHNDGKKA